MAPKHSQGKPFLRGINGSTFFSLYTSIRPNVHALSVLHSFGELEPVVLSSPLTWIKHNKNNCACMCDRCIQIGNDVDDGNHRDLCACAHAYVAYHTVWMATGKLASEESERNFASWKI